LASSQLLVQAASGLEKLMVGSGDGILKDSTVAQISAAIYYQANVLSQVTTNNGFEALFAKTLFNQINKDFGLYIDAQARMKPKALHHVYEWDDTGNSTKRLFRLSKKMSNGLSFQIGYKFILSKTAPVKTRNQKRYVFKNKASIMEQGIPVIITPRTPGGRLVFEYMGEPMFMPKGASVTVQRPGGRAATHQFKLHYAKFFTGDLVNLSIKKSGFQRIFNDRIARAMGLPLNIRKVKYSFSPNAVRMQSLSAVQAAFGGIL
jgi:hypothetical protein